MQHLRKPSTFGMLTHKNGIGALKPLPGLMVKVLNTFSFCCAGSIDDPRHLYDGVHSLNNSVCANVNRPAFGKQVHRLLFKGTVGSRNMSSLPPSE